MTSPLRIVVVLGLGAISLKAAGRCDPPAKLLAFIGTLPSETHARIAALEERLKRTPDDVTVNRLFVDLLLYHRNPIRERYRRLLENHPGSLDYEYLRARSLVGSNTKEALRLYAQILEQDADYPWVHLSQLEIYRAEAFRDRKKLEASFTVITRVCPTLFEPYRYLNEIADNGAAARAAGNLRAMLREAKDPGELRWFQTLWAVEFRVRPFEEQDRERRQVAEDLKRLLPFESNTTIQPAIENGAQLVRDVELQQRIARQRRPDAARRVGDLSNAWIRAHPFPKDEDSPEKKRAYGRELTAQVAEWWMIAPDNVLVHYYDVRALIFSGASSDAIARVGDRLLNLVRRGSSFEASWLSGLARIYTTGGVLLDRVPALVAEAIERLDDPEAAIESDLAPSPRTAVDRQLMVSMHVDALLVLEQWYEKQGDRDKANMTLWQAADFLAARAPSEPADPEVRRQYSNARYSTLRRTAEIAEREGRKLDALNGYREACSLPYMTDTVLLARQRTLWKELGGTEEGWQLWTSPVRDGAAPKAAASPTRTEGSSLNRKLPPLSARDTEGNSWTLDRFAGKTTIVVVWASWCEPCRAELPYFAKLAERLKGRNDVLAISFNTDDNIAVAESFMRSYKFRFPALSVKQYAEDLMPMFSIPRTWVIRNGAIAEESVGFGRDGDRWVEQMLARLK